MTKRSGRFLLLTFYLSLMLLPFPGRSEAAELTRGKQLFTGNCAKCHGRNGEGFRKLYPPLTNSRFLSADIDRLPCVMKYGMKGEITVGGVVFNQTMPGNQRLSNEDMALIVNYMQQAWGKPITALSIEESLLHCDE